MAFRDLRDFLDALGGDLRRVAEPFEPRFEIAAALREARADAPALLFDHVAGHPGWRVAGNLIAHRRRLARAFGCAEDTLAQTWLERKARAVEPVAATDAPVHEVVATDGALLDAVPILTHHELDAAPYVTTGVVLCRDPASGQRGMGIHRLMKKGGRRLGILLANPPIAAYHAAAEARGEPLEVAVALGLEPALVAASVVRAGPGGADKMAVAGALRGAPVELVRAATVNVEVPARAELVIEGRVLPGVREDEGPFGENTGAYFTNSSPVIEVTAVTHRRSPIYPGLVPWGADVDMLLWMAAGAELLGQLRMHVAGVADLEVAPGTAGFAMTVAVSGRPSRAEVRRLIHLALALDKRLKCLTVVDDDVDIRDPRAVAWALATRHRPAHDTVVVAGTDGYVIDPSSAGGAGSKVGFDATRGGGGAAFDKARLDTAALAKARAVLADLMNPEHLTP